mmetsp:Transcript_21848/g.37319  ORF Transcript_21848/g.37319 Transcript_21848/m.37319 type:complete len:270 (-) Transcript_21848:152-961(-)
MMGAMGRHLIGAMCRQGLHAAELDTILLSTSIRCASTSSGASSSIPRDGVDRNSHAGQTTSGASSPLQSLHEQLSSRSPLQSLPEQLASGSPLGTGQTDTHPVLPQQARAWMWYDKHDEATWQKRELMGEVQGVGYAHLRNVPQSIKKVDRVLTLVRGMRIEKALAQCQAWPEKSAFYIKEVMEHALEDARDKELDVSRLIVDTIYATKGQYLRRRAFKGRGHGTTLVSRRCHVQVKLRELPEGTEFLGLTVKKSRGYYPPQPAGPFAR